MSSVSRTRPVCSFGHSPAGRVLVNGSFSVIAGDNLWKDDVKQGVYRRIGSALHCTLIRLWNERVFSLFRFYLQIKWID